ncbi:MAG TPA: DUF6607 family protein [Novosphingobium sp.]|nr:DUF6607 family protein [Novosphingobium sp.]
MLRTLFKAALLATGTLLSSPLLADAPTVAAAARPDAFAADRAAILAMAGNYKVTFDLRETTSWRADYTPLPSKLSGGHEAVRVIEDSGRRIVLQHLLVVKDEAGKTIVVKHWRQDWTYEPESVLSYAGKGQWKLEPVPAALRAGRWSQTVWQTDDSPRYGGWGQWSDEGGVRRWRSSWTWRPLARRDAVRHPPYDRYLAINRHSPTPAGWIHWQDNIKMGPEPGSNGAGKLVAFVQESGLNTYVRDGAFDTGAADAYWRATSAYWAGIRKAWDAAIAANGGLHVAEVAETGSAGAEKLMGLADEVQAGRLRTDEAIDKGRAIIAQVSG